MAERTCTIEDCRKPLKARGMCAMHYQRWRLAERVCSHPGCSKREASAGYCATHYQRLQRLGTVELPTRPTEEDRFFSRVVQSGDCWLWTGPVGSSGYGNWHGTERVVHRWIYEHMIGPIPPGLHLDHLCRVRRCVNPYHLDPVPQRVNNQRAYSEAFRLAALEAATRSAAKRRAAALAQTHCKRGHEYTEQNTIWQKGRTRVCRACANEAARRYQQRKKAS